MLRSVDTIENRMHYYVHASAQCEFTTKRERFYGIGRQKNLFIQQKFRSPYTIKPLSCNKYSLLWGAML